MPDAIAQFQAALRIDPDYAEAHYNLGNALSQLPGRLPDAIAQSEAVLRLEPGDASAHSNLGLALANSGGPHKTVKCAIHGHWRPVAGR
jgi:tetratricopeptide (TPR) repeat protein